MPPTLLNFGCRLNAYEGEVMRAHAEAAGHSNAIVINSCTVTAEADRQVRQAIRRARKEHPHAPIIVTGCGAQVKPEEFAAMPEVTHVLGNQEKLERSTWDALKERGERAMVNDIMSVRETASHMVTSFEGRARAFVQIQNGCDHRCTFCIIPFGRGPSRSVPAGEVVTEVRALVEQGFQEIVFTGVDISDYGKDLPGSPTLGALIKRVLQLVPELPRLRLSSIDAVEVDDTLFALLAEEPRLMPHLHISLQAGDDMVLKRMKRRHLRADILAFCERVRRARPGMVFGADIIAGFPTETEAMFDNTLKLVDDAGLTWLHVFPYSARSGTPAAKMPQVPKAVRKERASRLREAGERRVREYLASQVGKDVPVLMETATRGRTEPFAVVHMEGEHAAGSIVHARLTAHHDQALQATPASLSIGKTAVCGP